MILLDSTQDVCNLAKKFRHDNMFIIDWAITNDYKRYVNTGPWINNPTSNNDQDFEIRLEGNTDYRGSKCSFFIW